MSQDKSGGNQLDQIMAEANANLARRSLRSAWTEEDLPWQLGSQLAEDRRASGSFVLSQILYGEQASLRLVRQLLEKETAPEHQKFLESQAADEARHVEVFRRYITLLGEVQPPVPALAAMAEGMLELPGLVEKVIAMHILVEGMALEAFHEMARKIDDPLLRELLRRVFADESRHVAFGVTYARRLLDGLDQAGRDRVAAEGGRFAVLAAAMIREQQATATEFGIDLRAIQQRTLRVLFRRLARLDFFNGADFFQA